MFNFSKVSSLALGLVLVGGLGLSNLASASTQSPLPHSQSQLLVEGGSDRLQQNRVAEGGAERLQDLRERVAEGGSDRLIQNRVAEGGADRLQELRERVASIPANAVLGGVIVAENRAEFGSKYQRY
jgi:sirohydrochlorin ferrochelatase